MNDMRIIALFVALVPALAIAAPPPWQPLADCAAAYRANAGIEDPDRPSSMTAMISDEAGDYLKAAQKAYRGKGGHAGAKAAVEAQVASRAPGFGKMSRSDLDKFIDACPQLEAPG